jgi:hypothetical protein
MKLDKSRADFQTTQRLHRLERVKQFRQPSRLSNNDDDDGDGGDDDNEGGGGYGGYGGTGFEFERGRTASVTTQSSTLSFSTHRGSRGVVVERLAQQLDQVRLSVYYRDLFYCVSQCTRDLFLLIQYLDSIIQIHSC